MSNLIKQAEEEVEQIILSGFGKLAKEGKLGAEAIPGFNVEIPNDKTHGDFATNIAMVCSKTFRLAPRKIAEMLIESFVLDNSLFYKAEVAGPGFINFFLSEHWFSVAVENVLHEGKEFGRTFLGIAEDGVAKKVIVEFVSANPTGPMHVGNARGGAIGDCLAGVLDFAGYDVSREFYVNDAGNQIVKLATSLEVRYLQIYQGESIEMPEDAYQGIDITEHAQNFANIHGEKYVSVSSEERREALVNYALPINIAKLETDLESYRIKYDVWFRESTLHNSGAVDKVIEILKLGEHTYELEGTLWFKATNFGAEKDFVLVRSNGIPTYIVSDIAYHYNKLVTRGFERSIDVLGADHHGYVSRLKAAMQAFGVNPDRVEFVIMQMVFIMRDGKPVKLSKRSGKAITLVTLLEEVSVDAARFFFNLREANSHCEFDLDLAIEESSKNPVFYVQYAHARAYSVIKNIEDEGIDIKGITVSELDILSDTAERDLIRHLASLPVVVDDAANNLDSSRITRYSLDLAALFHKFYSSCKVKGEDVALTRARLAVCKAVLQVLENCSSILKIDSPNSM